MVDGFDDWRDEQLRKRGWSKSDIKGSKRGGKWGIVIFVGLVLSIFAIGLPIVAVALLPTVYYFKRYPAYEYTRINRRLDKEFKRRDKVNEPLFEDLTEEWWGTRVSEDYRYAGLSDERERELRAGPSSAEPERGGDE